MEAGALLPMMNRIDFGLILCPLSSGLLFWSFFHLLVQSEVAGGLHWAIDQRVSGPN